MTDSINREDVIRMAKESGFKACVGTTDKEGNYHPFVNALGKDIPIEWLERFAALAALRAQPAEPLVFGMRGPKMTFTIGNQSFTLDYEPETTEEYVFMGDMLKAAISKLPRGVKIGAQPADPFKKLSDAQVLWLAESHGVDVYASNPLAFYADLISTTPAQPDHSELLAAIGGKA